MPPFAPPAPSLRVATGTTLIVCVLGLLLPAQSYALTLTLQGTTNPAPGITLYDYRTSSPATNTWVAAIDLCTNRIYVDATRAPSGTQSTGGWAGDQGHALATNGDFYTTGPTSVYGDAIGGGVQWPIAQLGTDPANSGEWFYRRYGWIAFGHDAVWYTHSRWVKQNSGNFATLAGWAPGTIAPDPPPGALALVSGFPEIVVEGVPMTCSNPTASTCFPDRSDMRTRHPRTAMGLSQDMGTFYLAVVDGRTSSSSGMYGSELADLMGQIGAWVAFNLDGGGSSQMWADGEGYINDVDGNNSGNGTRSVANHWGIWAGTGTGLPLRPGHCMSATPCGTVPPGGTTIEEDTPCFRKFGGAEWWRSETVGSGGHLYWTNAWNSEQPDNWAHWQLHFEEAGLYEVEYWADISFAVYDEVPYDIRANGTTHEVISDQGASSGWRSLGTFDFAAGGSQWVAVYDDHDGTVPANQHVAVDAIRVTRAEPYCGDAVCDEAERCGPCPGDCPVVEEQPANSIDDDCDGEVDEGPTGDDDDDATPSDDDDADDDTVDDDTSPQPDDDTTAADDDTTPEADDDSGLDDDSAAGDDDTTLNPRLPRPGFSEEGCDCAGAGFGAMLVLPWILLGRRPRKRPSLR